MRRCWCSTLAELVLGDVCGRDASWEMSSPRFELDPLLGCTKCVLVSLTACKGREEPLREDARGFVFDLRLPAYNDRDLAVFHETT